MRSATTATAPDGGHHVIISALRDILPHDDAKAGRTTAPVQEVEISQPIPVYRLTLNQLLESVDAQAADQVGWRYVVKTEPHKFGVADLSGVKGERVRFSSFSENTISNLFVQALHVAQDEAGRSPYQKEIRCLDIPSLYVSTLWITFDPPAFVPYVAPNSVRIKTMSVDPALIKKLAQLAQSEMMRGAR